MVAIASEPLTLLDGNVRLVDRTRDRVHVQTAGGIVREEALNRWFSRHVPRAPWRDVTAAERRALHAPRYESAPSILYALDFPERLRSTFWEQFARRTLTAEADAGRKTALDELRALLLEILAADPVLTVQSVRTFDLMLSPPHSAGTAFDARSGKFVGLHLDDHENLGFDERSRGFQLLSINLGSASRYFQFVNHDVVSLLRLIGGVAAIPVEARTAATLVQTVFQSFPRLPVARITLQPGQGYLAVTQDMIHDGGTNHLGRPDVSRL